MCIKEKDDFCQETYEMPIVSWKYSHELEGGEGGVQSHVQTTGRRRQCNRPARRVTGDVCSREKTTFAGKLMKCPLVPGNVCLSLKEEKAECRAMCRRQAADSQCNRPEGTVTADVCSKEKATFARKLGKCPMFPGNLHELKEEKAGCTAMCRRQAADEAMQSSGKESD